MTRRTSLEEVLFPVTLVPLFAEAEFGRLQVPSSQAVVDTHDKRVLGVVSRDYVLVTNQNALDLAHKCARQTFPETSECEWYVDSVDAPGTGSYCAIDLRHNSGQLDFEGVPGFMKPEVYGPFIRVVNSYNRSRALCFDIGYYRKVCSNGMVLPESLVRFHLSHQRRDLGADVRFEIHKQRLQNQRHSFQTFMDRLLHLTVPQDFMVPLTCAALELTAPVPRADTNPRVKKDFDTRAAAWNELEAFVASTVDGYVQELGANAYAVMNTVTDVASKPPENLTVRRDRHSMQKRRKVDGGIRQIQFGQRFRLARIP